MQRYLAPLRNLRDMPNVNDPAAVNRSIELMRENRPQMEKEILDYCENLGAWCYRAFRGGDAEAMKAIGKSFEGTMARARWNLDGRDHGVRKAVMLLAHDTKLCNEAWTKGFMAEGVDP